jgi:ubiquitin-conjugating enzyme E2 J2
MATDICVRRLTKELAAFKKDPMQEPRITVSPNERNILEMHYVIEGSKGTPYDGGVYHGKLIFPKEYPLKPPSVIMCTPSGRFHPNRRLCLSMSDFHPESWNPMWSVSTILTGLYSFMIENSPTMGSIETSNDTKRKLAAQSLEYNVKNTPVFSKLFPEYLQRHKDKVEQRHAVPVMNSNASSSGLTAPSTGALPEHMPQAVMAAMAGVVAIFSIVVAMRFI